MRKWLRGVSEQCKACGKYRPECGADYDDSCPHLDELGLPESKNLAHDAIDIVCMICYAVVAILIIAGVIIIILKWLNLL